MSYYYKDYIWIVRKLNGVLRYDPPSDPSFYDTTSHDNASEEDLTETTELLKAVLEEWREWDEEDAADNFSDLIEQRKPRHDKLTHILQHVETILRRRKEREVEDEALEDHDEGNSQSQSIFPPHRNLNVVSNVGTTSPPRVAEVRFRTKVRT
jgi:hypothetical protein